MFYGRMMMNDEIYVRRLDWNTRHYHLHEMPQFHTSRASVCAFQKFDARKFHVTFAIHINGLLFRITAAAAIATDTNSLQRQILQKYCEFPHFSFIQHDKMERH